MLSGKASRSINLAMILMGITLTLSSGLVQTFRSWVSGKVATGNTPAATTPAQPTASFGQQYDQSLAAYTINGQAQPQLTTAGSTGATGAIPT